MSKTELVDAIAAKTGFTKADSQRACDAMIESIKEGVKKHGKVTLVGFGTFSAKTRPARDGINPLTKEKIHIPEKVAATFKAGSKFKEYLND